jgi:serine/threonine protein kinase
MVLSGRYYLERRLGRGAMGQVYLAKDQNIGKKVAVKTVRQDLLNSDDLQEGEAIARFEREARAAASIRHPHCVDVTDFGKTQDGVFYLVMEYVEGETLHRLLRREGTLDVKRAVNLLRQISEGVEAAHEAGILHRDLKPANIFIMKKRSSGGDGFIKVGDFGLAKIVSQTVTDVSSNATPSSRGIIGTPEFMSPEQMQPELGLDARSDIYSIGTIAYLMLGGRTPFIGDMMQLVMQKVMQSPPLLSTLRTDIPKNVEAAIMRSIAKDAAERPATVHEFVEELERATNNIVENPFTKQSRLIIMAPEGAEVYLNDERKGSIGSSGRLILNSVPPGRHVLRVSKAGEKDDYREIEVREDSGEQVIQAQLKPANSSKPSPSQEGSSSAGQSSLVPGIVACTKCGARFSEGAKFCGRCGNTSFTLIVPSQLSQTFNCPRCQTALPINSKFCGRCGLNMTGTQSLHLSQPPSLSPQTNPPTVERVCRRCGNSYPPHIKFCGRCGLNLIT